MQMIFERVSGGQGGEETLKMVYDELREYGAPVRIGDEEPDAEDRAYITQAFEGVMQHREELDSLIERTARGWKLAFVNGVLGTIEREKKAKAGPAKGSASKEDPAPADGAAGTEEPEKEENA